MTSFDLFTDLFSKSLQNRNIFTSRMPSWFNGVSEQWPPVIGFGLPSTATAIPCVTVGLNPSNRELERGRIPDSNDVLTQWKRQSGYFRQECGQLDWFDKSDAFLQAAIGRTHRQGIPHLDLSPQPTAGGFDGIYDKKASATEKDLALQFLAKGAETSLLPLLAFLAAEHALTKVVIYGYVPGPTRSKQGGSSTLKDFFWAIDRPFELQQIATSDGLRLGFGTLRAGHAWTKAVPLLGSLDFIFLARGPSSLGNMKVQLDSAGARIRELGWLQAQRPRG